MPLVHESSYTPPLWLKTGHVQTMFPSLFRRVAAVPFVRSHLATPDGDEIVLDTLQPLSEKSRRVVILSHGLEGNSRGKYIRGMSLAFAEQGWDCIARNFRCCGGEMNRLPTMYHSGQTDDIHSVVEHCIAQGYEEIFLVGFSMGGNQTLKYLGEDPDRVPVQVKAAAVFSVPCNLPGAAGVLDMPQNAVYMWYFLRTLREKVRRKHSLYPLLYPLDGLDAIRTFREFDGRYTAPVHGFDSAQDYWEKAACLPHLHRIRTRCLLVNAVNDPFLSSECSPADVARGNPHFFLETPAAGGHVGFTSPLGRNRYWSESRAVAFFHETLGMEKEEV